MTTELLTVRPLVATDHHTDGANTEEDNQSGGDFND